MVNRDLAEEWHRDYSKREALKALKLAQKFLKLAEDFQR